MECKSCGSVKFRYVHFGLYECEYCGRQVEHYDTILRTDNPKNDYFSKMLGYCILDPTRTITYQCYNESIAKTIELQNRIKENESKIDALLKKLRSTKKCI